MVLFLLSLLEVASTLIQEIIMSLRLELLLDRTGFSNGTQGKIILARVLAQNSLTVDRMVIDALVADHDALESLHFSKLIDREDAALLGYVFEHAGRVFERR